MGVVEHGQEVAKQVDLTIPLRVLVFPPRSLAEILQLGLRAKQSILDFAELRVDVGSCGRGLRLAAFQVGSLVFGCVLHGHVPSWVSGFPAGP